MPRVDDLPERIAAKIAVDVETGCWLWTGARSGGYGQADWEGRLAYAHRLVYHLLADQRLSLNPGRAANPTLDHLCRTPACVNPQHLQIVTNRENVLRGRCGVLSPHASRFVGVWRNGGRWQARIYAGGRRIHLGLFADDIDAARAYDDAAEIHYGERTNERLGLYDPEPGAFGQLRLFEP